MRYIAFLLLVSSMSLAQGLRVRSMGGMGLAISDPDFSLGLYDLGNNPAWLMKDELLSRLIVTPSASQEWGELHRRYDPSRTVMYGAGFDIVKSLDEKGTFRGYTYYGIEKRRDVYRSLKRSPYAGEGFFVTDTTTGNFTYNGPTVEFVYSYELVPAFFIGASARYQLLDGLKNMYSQTKSLYRDLQANVGLAYQPYEDLVVGLSFRPSDNQESMEAKSEELYEVELFNYRGETYASRQRGSSIDHKVRNRGNELGLQLNHRPLESLELGMRGTFGFQRTQILINKGLEKEVEEGYARRDYYSLLLQARYVSSENLTLGASVHYTKNREWSRYSALDLMIWDWRVSAFSVASGVAYRIPSSSMLVGMEYEYNRPDFDSSKYIDNRFVTQSVQQHVIRTGVEFEAWDQTFLRLGYVFRSSEFDLRTGGKDVVSHSITGGTALMVSEVVSLDVLLEYTTAAPRNTARFKRSSLAGGIMLKIMSL